MRVGLVLLLLLGLAAGCGTGTTPQELEQLRARVSTLEAENAQLQGQASLTESERDQLRAKVNDLEAKIARQLASQLVATGEHLTVVPRQVRPGEWVAIHVRNYPVRLLPQVGVALRGSAETNLAHVKKLSGANLFLLPVPQTVSPGTYSVVLGEAGALGPGAKLDDRVNIEVQARQ